MKTTIIIPVKEINDYIREGLFYLEKLKGDFEVIICPDFLPKDKLTVKNITLRLIASGPVGPSEKRDMMAKKAKGEILAFLDDDAFPQANWLKRALVHFQNKEVGAVAGPGITPAKSNFWQKVSANVFESYLGGAGMRCRYLPEGKTREVDDWPSVNLIVRATVFKKIGGFSSHYWPGEDTLLCLNIIKAGYKILYEPKAVVYHHRRTNFIKHFQQIGNYALHRGYFAKKYSKNSLKPIYFMPTLFVLYLSSFLVLPLFLARYPLGMFYGLPLGLYFLALLIDGIIISIRWKNPLVGLLTLPMIFLTHLWYGLKFIQGLLTFHLKR